MNVTELVTATVNWARFIRRYPRNGIEFGRNFLGSRYKSRAMGNGGSRNAKKVTGSQDGHHTALGDQTVSRTRSEYAEQNFEMRKNVREMGAARRRRCARAN